MKANLISDINSIKDVDKKYINNETLLFGVNDNSISCFINNNLLNIITSTKITDSSGNIKIEIPVQGGKMLKILIADVNVTANTKNTVRFFESFESKCYFVNAIQKINDVVNGFMIDITGKESFDLTLNGGENNEVFRYFAIGI